MITVFEPTMIEASSEFTMDVSKDFSAAPFAVQPESTLFPRNYSSDKDSDNDSECFDEWQRWATKNQRQSRRSSFFSRKTNKRDLLDDDIDVEVEQFMQFTSHALEARRVKSLPSP